MNRILEKLLLFTFFLSLSSCSWLYYVPNSQNVPMLEEKGEVAINLALSSGERSAGFELQSAFSIVNHLGFQVNSMLWTSADGSVGVLADFAPGLFFKLSDHFVYEMYGGYGVGRIQQSPFQFSFDSLYSIDLEPLRYDKYWIQPAIGYTTKNVDFIFSSRFNLIDYYGKIPLYAQFNENNQNVELKRLNEFYTMEPALTLRVGWRNFKFKFQTVYVIPLLSSQRPSAYSDYFPIFYDRFNINVGLHFNFGGHYNAVNPDI